MEDDKKQGNKEDMEEREGGRKSAQTSTSHGRGREGVCVCVRGGGAGTGPITVRVHGYKVIS